MAADIVRVLGEVLRRRASGGPATPGETGLWWLVTQRLDQTEQGPAVLRQFESAPGGRRPQAALGGLLDQVLSTDRQFAEQVGAAVEQARGASQASTTSGSTVTTTASGRWSTAVAGNQSIVNNRQLVIGGGAAALVLVVLVALFAPFSPVRVGSHGDPTSAAGPARITISPTAGPVTAKITVVGEAFRPGEEVRIFFHITEVVRVNADADGQFRTTITPPAFYAELGSMGMPTYVSAVGRTSGLADQRPFSFTGGGSGRPPGFPTGFPSGFPTGP
ncbi:MAG TPA: hypothetical protein VLJ59_00595 [Mycobacteriales bacterium]|nr:hypothetical protein [Mycobacteriales bacterium]